MGCRPRPALTAETIVGGIHEAVFSRILAGRTDELPGLADDLLVAILMLDVDAQELSRRDPPPPGPLAAHQEDSLIQHAAEPERVPDDRFGAVPERPAAGWGAPAPIRVGDDPIQGDEFDDDNAHDGSLRSMLTGTYRRHHRDSSRRALRQRPSARR